MPIQRNCYQCGGWDHFARDCTVRVPEVPPGPRTPGPPPASEVIRPPSPPADPERVPALATAAREACGWGQGGTAPRTRFADIHRQPARTVTQLTALAAQQASESRSARLAGYQ